MSELQDLNQLACDNDQQEALQECGAALATIAARLKDQIDTPATWPRVGSLLAVRDALKDAIGKVPMTEQETITEAALERKRPGAMIFNFQEIASAGTGFLFGVSETDNGIGEAYKVLNFMTGNNLFRHQLPLAFEACQPAIFAQHPWLKNLHDVLKYSQKKCSREEYRMAFKGAELKYKSKYGDEFELTPLRKGTT